MIPRPIRVDIRLPKRVKGRLLTILRHRESIVGYDGIVEKAGREEIGIDPGTVRAVGVNSVGVDCEGIIVGRAL